VINEKLCICKAPYCNFSYSANAKGSRFIQRAVDGATTEEIIMVYKEIMPYVRTLAVDMFGNHAVQKVRRLSFSNSDPICACLFFFLLLLEF
jgi:hypothetical protein